MNAHAFDSPLALLHQQTQLTLTALQQAVERYLNDASTEALAPAVAAADQLRGVFVVVEAAEAAELMAELQTLLGELISGSLTGSEPVHQALLQATLQTPHYWQWLQHQHDRPPFPLASLLAGLRAVRDGGTSAGGVRAGTAGVGQLAKGLRPLLQRGLLSCLRGQTADGLGQLHAIVTKLRDNASDEHDYRLWWLAVVLLGVFAKQKTVLDKDDKRLLRELDQQVGWLAQHGQLDPSAAEQTAQRLAERLPEEYDPARLAERDDYRPPQPGSAAQAESEVLPLLLESETLTQLADLLKESLGIGRGLLLQLQGEALTADNPVLAEVVRRLNDTAKVLGLVNLAVPADLLSAHAVRLSDGVGSPPGGDEILTVAAQLLLVQHSLDELENFYFDGTLAALVADNLDLDAKTALLLEHEHNRARAAVSRAALGLTDQARACVAAHLNSDVPPQWERLPVLFRQLSGVLAMLENHRGCEQFARVEALSRQLADGADQPTARLTVEFADLIVYLERYLQLLGGGRHADEQVLDEICQRLDRLAALLAAAGEPAGEPEAEFLPTGEGEQADDALAPLAEPESESEPVPEMVSTPADSELEPIPLPADDVDGIDMEIQPAAEVVDDAVDIDFPPLDLELNSLPEATVSENFSADTVTPESSDLDSELQQHLETAFTDASDGGERTPTPPQAGPDQDQELLEIFYEEALGEVDNLDRQLPVWRANLYDEDAMLAMRRSFHTLKGSGRMVGEMVVGEFAWAFEQLLNQVRDGKAKPTVAMAEAISRARDWLDGVVYAGRVSGFEARAEQLQAQAELLLRGEELPAETVSEPVADAVPAPQAEAEFEPPVLDDDLAAEPAQTEPAPADEPEPSAVAEPEPHIEAKPPQPAKTPPKFAPVPPAAAEQPAFIAALPEGADPELVEVFLDEASDILDASEFTLQRWGSDPENPALVNDLRREMHTLKGGSRLCGLTMIGDLAHAAEAVMEAVPRGDLKAGPETIERVQRSLDGLSNMISRVREGMPVSPADDLINELYGLLGADDDATVQSRLQAEQQASDKEFRDTFLQEAQEHLDSGASALGRWRADPQDQASLGELRRALHTIKGSSRLVGIGTMGDLAQGLLDMADACKDGRLETSENLFSLSERGLAKLAELCDQIQADEQPAVPTALIAEVGKVLAPVVKKAAAVKPAAKKAAQSGETIRVDSALLGNLINQMGESSIYRARVEQGVSGFRFNLDEMDQTLTRLRQQMRRLEMETEAQILFRYEETSKEENDDFDPLELDRFAELQQLSRSLMEVVDDLANIHGGLEDQTQNMAYLLDQQGKVNKDIQQGLMRTGMVEFSTVVPRLRRVVRQAAQELSKRAQLVVHGDEAEIDRTILDNMVAPLEHMLRNALTHGIETPEEREKADKPASGTITMSLTREGSELVLTIVDDGGGINYERIRAKGEEKGMLKPGQQASEQELIALLLQPGFSTATEVTQLAGRGVGMDVLNEAIKEMRGALQIQSQPGQGTTFTIRLPFSLAVTQALLVKAGGSTYAVPMLSLEAVDRLSELEINSYLAGDAVTHYYGEHEYPLHSLSLMFGHDPTAVDNNDVKPAVLLFRTAEASAALQVDEIVGHQEVIVKPVGPQLHKVPGISGATVLGDGRVVVVLELAALVRKLATQTQQQMAEQLLQNVREEEGPQRTMAMVIDDSITMRKVTARFLTRHDIDVKVAKDGVEAVALLEEHVPDFMILDIEMPRMDGFEVVAHVRNQPRLKHLPIIMVTSRSGEKHRSRATRLGVDDYLIKPYQEDELMASIQKVLKARGMELIH